MGGIIGKLSFERDQTLAHPVLEQMLDALRHHGSDGRVIHTAPGIALGWRGEEPSPSRDVASNEARTVLVVADAAIGNAGDLGAELTRVGHVVRHGTGAELIAHAYEEWGDRCVDRLHGTFAFAIWDSAARRLLLARDLSGARPLYYALLHGHGVVFASTIRSLVTDPGVGREWCPAALDAYLAYGYVPAPLSPYQRISKLEAGHRLVVDGRRFLLTGGLRSSGYEGDDAAAIRRAGPATAVDQLEAELGRVVAEQPPSAGVLFSGGPASGALLTAAGRRTTVIVALEQNMHALAGAHAQAQAAGADPIIEIVAPDMAALAADVAAFADEPNADAALVAHYAVCLAARRHIDTALSGHGGMTLWSDRGQEPGAWTADERFAIYTKRFAHQVLDGPSPEEPLLPESMSASLATAGQIGLDAGIRLYFPHADPRLVQLAAGARTSERNLLRTLVTRSGLRTAEPAVATQRRREPHPWLRGAIRGMVPALLLSGRFDGRGMVSPGALRRLWDEHRNGQRDHARRLWSLLMLELWFREFIDGGVVEAPFADPFARAA